MEGDTQKDLVLTQARAMVIREYLVENFGFDDSQLKTLGIGKQAGTSTEADWGSIQILIFPLGTVPPPEKAAPTGVSTINNTNPLHAITPTTENPMGNQ